MSQRINLERRGVGGPSNRLILEVLRFLMVGAASAALNTLIIVALTELFHIYYLVSYLICFLIVTGFGFLANRKWSFRVAGKAQGREWARYFLVTTVGTMLAMAIIWACVQLGCPYPIATFLSAGLIAPLNFVSHRRYSFGEGTRSQ